MVKWLNNEAIDSLTLNYIVQYTIPRISIHNIYTQY